MSDQLFSGKITSFTQEQGFGKVTLADGRELSFDYSVCNYEPGVGDDVRVAIGPARWGNKMKVTFMESAATES
jgi:hypothetical protein